MLREVTENNKPLIAAMERYHDYKGEYPDKLEDLIPEFISAIPESKISTKSDYEYFRKDDGGYEIIIRFSGKSLKEDMLIYNPKYKNKPIKPEEKDRWVDDWYYLQFDWL